MAGGSKAQEEDRALSQGLAAAVHHELIVKKSRFIACVQPVDGRAQALQLVAALRQQHPDATHVCWALLAGGESAAVDDGEPGGPAGRPMLHVLRQQDLDGVLATVVRYFGGVKLGAGGLVRAYTDAVAQALLAADKVPLVRWLAQACALPYALEGVVRHALQQAPVRAVDLQHTDEVLLRYEVAADARVDVRAQLDEIGQGRLRWLEP